MGGNRQCTPVAAHADLALYVYIRAITNASQSLHTSRHAKYVPMLLPLPRGMEIWRSPHGTSNRATASMPRHWHKLDCPRAALNTTHPHSSQNVSPPAQLPVAAGTAPQALPSTPSSVQVVSSQQRMGIAGIPPQALSGTPLDPFKLAFIRGNISVCFGCKQRYPNPINPPGDLCIMHREWRSFTLPGSSAPQSQFGNAYYHLHLPCIWSMWPQFDPQRHLIIPSAIATALLPAHKQALAASFKVFLD